MRREEGANKRENNRLLWWSYTSNNGRSWNERHAHLQGFGAVGQESLDVARRRRNQIPRIVGLYGVVKPVVEVYLKRSEKENVS